MNKLILSTLLSIAAFCSFGAANQSITCGDGELRWEVVKTYYSSGIEVGVQTNSVEWISDSTGFGIDMILDKEVWSYVGINIYSNFTELNPNGGNGITWGVFMESPWEFFVGLYDSSVTTSTIYWSDHTGTKIGTATTTDPDIDTHTVWLDWTKSHGVTSPRITLGAKPKNFNKYLSGGGALAFQMEAHGKGHNKQ